MLSLTDNDLRVVVEAAKSLPVDRRSDFLQLTARYKTQNNLILSIHMALRELSRRAAASSN
jgi:hypothetical protein